MLLTCVCSIMCPQPPLLIRTLLGIATALAVYIGLCVAWLVGSTLVRRHSNGLSLSTQLTSSSKSSPSSNSAYSPKEYSKVRAGVHAFACVLWTGRPTRSACVCCACEEKHSEKKHSEEKH